MCGSETWLEMALQRAVIRMVKLMCHVKLEDKLFCVKWRQRSRSAAIPQHGRLR